VTERKRRSIIAPQSCDRKERGPTTSTKGFRMKMVFGMAWSWLSPWCLHNLTTDISLHNGRLHLVRQWFNQFLRCSEHSVFHLIQMSWPFTYVERFSLVQNARVILVMVGAYKSSISNAIQQFLRYRPTTHLRWEVCNECGVDCLVRPAVLPIKLLVKSVISIWLVTFAKCDW